MKKLLVSVLMVAAAAAWSFAQTPQAPAGNGNAPVAVPAPAPQTPAAAQPAAVVVKVEKLVVATGVENREATGAAASFGADVGLVYCWTKLSVDTPPAKIKYVWSMGGQKVSEYAMEIKAAGRWWASKKVTPGSWKVEVLSENGEALGSADFTVTAEAAKAAAPVAPAAPAAPAPAPAAAPQAAPAPAK